MHVPPTSRAAVSRFLETYANDLRRQFAVALTIAGQSAAQWARANGVTPGHLSQVLSGKHQSKRLIETVTAFIAAQLDTLR